MAHEKIGLDLVDQFNQEAFSTPIGNIVNAKNIDDHLQSEDYNAMPKKTYTNETENNIDSFTRNSQDNGRDKGKTMAKDESVQDIHGHHYSQQLPHNHADYRLPQDVKSIQEMEKLREQIQDMIHPYNLNLSTINRSLGNESTGSTDTNTLLRAVLPHSSPDLQLDENGVLVSSLASSQFVQKHSSPIHDSSLIAENTILKDNIEKERYRRKHCEKTIQDLQQRLLETQEQLAVSVSTDKKKETMIEQLDCTLANVVDGWKKHESARINLIERLKEENCILQNSKSDQDKALKQFQNDLAQAVEELGREQERAQQADEKNRKTFSAMESDYANLKQNSQSLHQTNTLLEEKCAVIVSEKDILEAEVKTFSQEKLQWHNEKQQLDQRLNDLEIEYKSMVSQLQEQLNTSESEIQDMKDKLQISSLDCQKLKSEVEACTQEKDTLNMELSLFESKFEAVKTKQDSEMRIKLEEEFNAKINEIQKEIMNTEEELRNSQRKQIQSLTLKHREEMEILRQQFLKEMSKKEEIYRQRAEDYEERLDSAHEQITTLTTKRQQLESQRGDLMRRMQAMMQQHWKETVSILNVDDLPAEVPIKSRFGIDDQLSSTMQNDLSSSHLKDYDSRSMSVPLFSRQINSTAEKNSQSQYTNAMILPDHRRPVPSHTSISVNSQYSALYPSATTSVQPTSHLFSEHMPANVSTDTQMRTSANDNHSNFQPFVTPDQHNHMKKQTINTNHSVIFDHSVQNRGKSSNLSDIVDSQLPHHKLQASHITLESLSNQQSLKTAVDSQADSYIANSPMQPSSVQGLKSEFKQDDPISLLYQDLDASIDESTAERCDTDNAEKSERQSHLSHLIEKLLQNSPTNYIEENAIYEEIPVKDNPKIDKNDDIVAANVVSHDVEKIIKCRTPEKAMPIQAPAFKKSVIRDLTQVKALSTSNMQRDPRTITDSNTAQTVFSKSKKSLPFKNIQSLPEQQALVDANAFMELFRAFQLSRSQRQGLEQDSSLDDISRLQKVYDQMTKNKAVVDQRAPQNKKANKTQVKKVSQLKPKLTSGDTRTQLAKQGTAWK